MGASALSAAPALAETAPDDAVSIESIKVTPDPVVIRGHDDVAVTATVQTVGAEDVKFDFEPTGRGGQPDCNPCPGAAKSSSGDWKTWEKTIVLDRRDPDGDWVVYVEATGKDGKAVKAKAYFSVKHVAAKPPYRGPRATRIEGFDASPEPVKKGRKLTLDGKLSAARCHNDWWWDGNVFVVGGDRCRDDYRWSSWRWLGWQEIKVYFHPAHGGKWQYVDTIETNPDGTFYTKIPAYWSGTWKVVFEGSRGLYGSSASDYVKVVR
ncbi:hypothetical protein DQ384_19135 [Sphaerisporangium album]|uniref:Uncharacterized protein n=2 Tax=Sphaerisporangium album TaxID=509200 RepID=A0A367FH62_9ACTN|nr:hypothetical protein DQ384_19135 [Sphaerisporangium album]